MWFKTIQVCDFTLKHTLKYKKLVKYFYDFIILSINFLEPFFYI